MVKFFKRIRQKLLAENRFSKYLLYATGEIILVVIGILIALSINNWNENRKDKEQERVVLSALLENLNSAKKQSAQLISEETLLKKRLIQILELEPNPQRLDNYPIPDTIFRSAVWELQSDEPTLNTYFNLKSTNQLGLIRNPQITENFTILEFLLNQLDDILNDRLSVHQIRIDNILEENLNFLPIVKTNVPEFNIENESINNYEEVLKERRVRNLLGMKLTLTQDAITRRIDLDNEIEKLISLLTEELGTEQKSIEVD